MGQDVSLPQREGTTPHASTGHAPMQAASAASATQAIAQSSSNGRQQQHTRLPVPSSHQEAALSGPRKQINSISALIAEAQSNHELQAANRNDAGQYSQFMAFREETKISSVKNPMKGKDAHPEPPKSNFTSNRHHELAQSSMYYRGVPQTSIPVADSQAADVSVLTTTSDFRQIAGHEAVSMQQRESQLKSQLNQRLMNHPHENQLSISQTSTNSLARTKLKNNAHKELYDQLMAQAYAKNAPGKAKTTQHKAEMVQNPGKQLRHAVTNVQTQSGLRMPQTAEHQFEADATQSAINNFQIRQRENMQRAKEIQQNVDKIKRLSKPKTVVEKKATPTMTSNSLAQKKKKGQNKQINDADMPRKPATVSKNYRKWIAKIKKVNSRRPVQIIASKQSPLGATQSLAPGDRHTDTVQGGHTSKRAAIGEGSLEFNNLKVLHENGIGQTKNSGERGGDQQRDLELYAKLKDSLRDEYKTPTGGLTTEQLEKFKSLLRNLSPNTAVEANERNHASQRIFTENNYSASKSDNIAGRHQNLYLSRKIERQDYYQKSSGSIKRPNDDESLGRKSSEYKKNVYTNMTSRVLDGHRKQEESRMNWNSQMAQSERQLFGSSKSQISFYERQGMATGLYDRVGNEVVQSAHFKPIPNSLRHFEDNLPQKKDSNTFAQTAADKLREFEVLSMDDRIVRKNKGSSELVLTSSLQVEPTVKQSFAKQTDLEIPIAVFRQATHRFSHDNNEVSDQPSNDQQPPQSKVRTANTSAMESAVRGQQSSVPSQMQRAKEQLLKIQSFEQRQQYQMLKKNRATLSSGRASQDAGEQIQNALKHHHTQQTKQEKHKEKMRERRRHAKELISEINTAQLPASRPNMPALNLEACSSAFLNQERHVSQPGIRPLDFYMPKHSAAPLVRNTRAVKFGGGATLLDGLIAFTLIQFDPSSFRKFICLSPNWNYLVLDGMDQAFKAIECDFINKFYEHLLFKRSYTNSSVIFASGRKGIRLDRVLVCEVLANSKHLNKCLGVHFAYKLHLENAQPIVFGPGKAMTKREQLKSQAEQEHMATYKMDIVKEKQHRLVWIHRDQAEESQDNNSSYQRARNQRERIKQRPLTQPIIQVCQGDVLEIAINFFSMQGLLNLSSVEWFVPQLSIPTKETVLNYDKDRHQQNPDRIMKIHCDLSRICEVEDSVVEWYEANYFQGAFSVLNLDHLRSHFTIASYQCAGVDGLICKIHLIASRPGRIDDPILGIPIVIKSSASENSEKRANAISASYNDDGEGVLVHEIKRVGFLIDRYVDLQLRIGDSLVVYLQRAAA